MLGHAVGQLANDWLNIQVNQHRLSCFFVLTKSLKKPYSRTTRKDESLVHLLFAIVVSSPKKLFLAGVYSEHHLIWNPGATVSQESIGM